MSAPLYPLWLDLRDRLCVVAGGGAVATRRVRGLLECGARVRVVAPTASAGLAALAAAGSITLERRPYRPGDAQGAALVFAATSVRAVNAQVAHDARQAGALVNVADDPAAGFQTAATVRRGAIALALGTGGLSPAATAALRAWLEALLTPEHERAVALLGRVRRSPALAPAAERATALLAAGDAAGAAAMLAVALEDGADTSSRD